MKSFLPFFLLCFLASCTNLSNQNIKLNTEQIDLKLDNSFRGISIYENDVWISGTDATIVHFDAQVNKWSIHQIPQAGKADFRDIEALDENTALAVSAGSPAYIYKTIDGGESWRMVYENKDSTIFLNAMEFWDNQKGLIFGDPMGKTITILKTTDAGENWSSISPENIPLANKMEGGFAASGTCLQVKNDGKAWIGVGGKEAKVYLSTDAGENWEAMVSPIFSGDGMQGIYSMAFKDTRNGIAVGGEWKNENPPASRAYTNDGGKSWHLGEGVEQYRSGCCYLFKNIYLATGLTGTDVSFDGGKNWNGISDLKLHGLEFSRDGKTGFGMGAKGKIYRFSVTEE